MTLPFDGAISEYLDTAAPDDIRQLIADSGDKPILTTPYPYKDRMKRRAYETEMAALQSELVKCQSHIAKTGQRVVVVFEGRDAAGKGGTIKRFREHLPAREARVIALSKPTEREQGQWYFQRYIKHLPTAGEIVFFDRSWYNRGVVEKVFNFCSDDARDSFFTQVQDVERLFVDDDIVLVKLWLNVGRAEQLRRFLDRERDPLKQWKLSWIDVEGLRKWDAYTDAIAETFHRSDSSHAPWTVIKTDDKRRARLAAIRHVLSRIDYTGKDPSAVGAPDEKICGGVDLWHA